MFKSKVDEAAYIGNIGAMEMFKFHQKANKDHKEKLKVFIKNKDTKNAWKHIQNVTGVKLHKSVNEKISPDILPKSGAGQWGTDELLKTYMKDTPGQSKILGFKEYKK